MRALNTSDYVLHLQADPKRQSCSNNTNDRDVRWVHNDESSEVDACINKMDVYVWIAGDSAVVTEHAACHHTESPSTQSMQVKPVNDDRLTN